MKLATSDRMSNEMNETRECFKDIYYLCESYKNGYDHSAVEELSS